MLAQSSTENKKVKMPPKRIKKTSHRKLLKMKKTTKKRSTKVKTYRIRNSNSSLKKKKIKSRNKKTNLKNKKTTNMYPKNKINFFQTLKNSSLNIKKKILKLKQVLQRLMELSRLKFHS